MAKIKPPKNPPSTKFKTVTLKKGGSSLFRKDPGKIWKKF